CKMSDVRLRSTPNLLTVAQTSSKKQADPADRHRKDDENYTKAKSQRQIAFACLKSNRSCHGPGITLDVPSDDEDCADFRDCAAECGQKCRQHSFTTDIHQRPDASEAIGAIVQKKITVSRP